MTQRAGVVVMYGVGQGAIQDVYFPRRYAELRESVKDSTISIGFLLA
jgi:hypothetical protein